MENRIIDLRKDLDLTQEQIAKKLGYHTTTYARWEHNPLQMKLNDLINLAKFHNVSLDYIAGLTNNKTGIGYNPKQTHNGIGNNIINFNGGKNE